MVTVHILMGFFEVIWNLLRDRVLEWKVNDIEKFYINVTVHSF